MTNITSKKYYLLLTALPIPILVYVYFSNWMTTAWYGDDLNIYITYKSLHTIGDKINIDVPYGKFRPIHSASISLLLELFQKNLKLYILFNVAIQSINTFLFARLLNLFLRSPYLSLAFSAILALSRFSLFNIIQLLNGGILEGFAMSFFLLFLYTLLKTIIDDTYTNEKKQKGILISMLFANLSMYTHERYIVTLAFLILVILFFPSLKTLSLKRKMLLVSGAVGSIILNFIIKKYFFSLTFFAGTGGTNISFSFSSALSFLIDGILSILQINSGPEYLTGIQFSSLSPFNKLPVFLILGIIAFIAILYFRKIRELHATKKLWATSHFAVLLFLPVIWGLLLIPAVVTIRLEPRWLQGPFSVLMLMVAIALKNLNIKNSNIKTYLLLALPALIIWSDNNYLSLGGKNIYLYGSNKFASEIKELTTKGIIRPNTQTLYLWETQRDNNTEEGIKWVLMSGNFFQLYQEKNKKLMFVDSNSYKSSPSPLVNLNKDSVQIIYIGKKTLDITDEYFQDSLKSFLSNKIHRIESSGN